MSRDILPAGRRHQHWCVPVMVALLISAQLSITMVQCFGARITAQQVQAHIMAGNLDTTMSAMIEATDAPSPPEVSDLTHLSCGLNTTTPNRYFKVDPKRNETNEMVIEISSRVTHQFSATVFKVFLEEVVGYRNVVLQVKPNDFNHDSALDRLQTDDYLTKPSVLFNTELWSPSSLDMSDYWFVSEAGKLVNPGRIGWFMPKTLLKGVWKKFSDSTDLIDWTQFRKSNFAGMFDITDKRNLQLISNYSYDSTAKRFYCTNSQCSNGTYTPDKCRSESCALLLAPDYPATSFVIAHIQELQLNVRVVWLGPNLGAVFRKLNESYERKNTQTALVALSWTPSDVIVGEGQYMSVIFPQCNQTNVDAVGCRYEFQRIMKYSWLKVDKRAELALRALKRLTFHDVEYSRMLRDYNRDYKLGGDNSGLIPKLVCDWYARSEVIWRRWALDLNLQDTLSIGGIFPLFGSTYTGKGIYAAAEMAQKRINNNTNILNGFALDLLIKDGQCRADKVMKEFIHYITTSYKSLVGILGPACSDTVEPLAGVSKYFKTIVISYSAEGASFSDRQNYPYFFRTIGENKQYKYIFREFFSRYKWKRFGALTEDGQKYTEYISHMTGFLQESGISLIENVKFPREKHTFDMSLYLKDLKSKHVRIIIADIMDEVARVVMCEAWKMDMTAKHGYIWFLPSWLNSTWYDTNYFNQARNEVVNCSTSTMIQAINGYFSITSAFFAPNDTITHENITVGEWRQTYAKFNEHAFSNYAGFAYDAMWTYATAVDKLLNANRKAIIDLHSANSTDDLVRYIQETDFVGVTGRIKFFGASRISDIHMMQWYNNESYVVAKFLPTINQAGSDISGGDFFVNKTLLRWLTAGIPDDGTQVCTFNWLAVFLDASCETTVIVVNVFLGIVVLIIATTVVFVVRKQYKKKMADSQKFFETYGINLDRAPMDLDEWEIPRDKVVLNRRLGEGAFGTVYGGEADLPDLGWVMVAVKTLKQGSSAEEKLDFLSEAEVMKRFDHTNIVKLIGVCMKVEPVFTVMEYMLFGDLKSFLLSRRNLVNEKDLEESDEISPKKLTNMALDVARALSYLADLKVVHRDIASRNCLISTNRCVKLGDFGMSRLMYENDYYRFNRKGMLPVRWMSPESLALGVFTPQSDIWSFGVLLYEIVTFGSFPFQGMTNNQVLEHVKAGNVLIIPSAVRLQLASLMKTCWHSDYTKRPTALQLVDFLANNPRLIHPCLEGPTSSVQIETTDQMEIQILDSHFRKCSSSLSTKHAQPLANGSVPQTSQSFDNSPIRQQPSPSRSAGLYSSPKKPNSVTAPIYSDDVELDGFDSAKQHQRLDERRLNGDDAGTVTSGNNSIDYCPREPLLGSDAGIGVSGNNRSNSLLALAKFVKGGNNSSSGNLQNSGSVTLMSPARLQQQLSTHVSVDFSSGCHDDSTDFNDYAERAGETADSDGDDVFEEQLHDDYDYMNITLNGQAVKP